jgi:hypothetical protein
MMTDGVKKGEKNKEGEIEVMDGRDDLSAQDL